MPVSDFLQVNISTAPVAPVQPGFGVMMILGACKNALSAYAGSLIQYYASTASMLTAGFLSTDPEYLAAGAAFAQTPAPPLVGVGRRTNLPTQRFVMTVLTAVASRTYTITVNGIAKSYTANSGGTDTTTTIAAALATAIGAPTGFSAATSALAVITLTSAATGNWCRVSATNPNADIDCQQTHADAGIVADIAAVAIADSTWYGVVSAFSSQAEVAALAVWTETNGKLYVADTQDSTTLGSGSSDIASTLKTNAYVRSPPWYHQDNGAFLGAAIMGNRFTYAPGSENWMFVALAGVPVMALNTTQVVNLKAKNCNYYYGVGVSMTATGITPSGQFIDTVRGRDWLASRIQTRVLTILTSPASAANPSNPGNAVPPLGKVPFTDQGIAAIEGEIRAALFEGVAAGFLTANPAPTVTMPKAASLTAGNRAARTIPNGAFAAQIAGAINNLTIAGVVQF